MASVRLVNEYLQSLGDALPTDKELCGVVHMGKVIQLPNLNPNPAEAFEIGQSWWQTLEASTLIWHTHLNAMDVLSYADLDLAKRWDKPVYMFNIASGKSDCYDPLAVLPYEGRRWAYTHSNCWELYRDFAQRELGLKLGEHRLPCEAAWESPKWNQWIEELPHEGFIEQPRTADKEIDFDNIMRGDLLLFKVGRTHNPNHCAAMYSLESNQILHQLTGGISRLVSFDAAWRNRINSVWRHKNA